MDTSPRNFTEVEVRRMRSTATGSRPDLVSGRWIVRTRHRRVAWELIVEPDADAHLVVVITAYPVES